ncbi:MAG: hypothetical protein ABIK65_10805 [Candidatus Eisenbacteria bacterium]
MNQRIITLFLLVALASTCPILPAFGEDGTPDPREATPEEVDPDGLEGIRTGPRTIDVEAVPVDGLSGSNFVKILLRYARVFGII